MSVQIATRIDDGQAERFRAITKRLGTTPPDAVRMFIAAFNESGGFPYSVRIDPGAAPFATEEEASDFADRMAMETINETR